MDWRRRWAGYASLFVIGAVCLGALTTNRACRQSKDPHFVFQAYAWLHGHLAVNNLPSGADDPAKIETVVLKDGRTVRGRRLRTQRAFRTTQGGTIALGEIARTVKVDRYVSFPPLPAVLLLPQVLLSGTQANDVLFTIFVAALILPLMFVLLRRLRAMGLSQRTAAEDLWFVALLSFGTVLLFSSVQGRVWYTAHVVSVALCICYLWCAVEAKHPYLAGLCLGCAAITRTPMAFMFPLFVLEAWRACDAWRNKRAFALLCARFAAPVVAIAVAAMIFNWLRFNSPMEFGHSYLDVRQQHQIEKWGLFSFHYLSRNLAVAFTLLPEFSLSRPWVLISGHGLALWFTTPALLYLLWPKHRGVFHRNLWITVGCVAIPTLFYQNSGWFQFGYRFSLDYMVLLVALLAIGGRRLTVTLRTVIVLGIVVNVFGAITFDRYPAHYGGSYDVVLRH